MLIIQKKSEKTQSSKKQKKLTLLEEKELAAMVLRLKKVLVNNKGHYLPKRDNYLQGTHYLHTR